MISIIWAHEKLRHKISKMEFNGKNIMQIVAESYGLTFNIISMLWDSGLFRELPTFVQNVKSRKIIEKKYGKLLKLSKTSEVID
jgi:hypothetical protein